MIQILMVEDSPSDALLLEDALVEGLPDVQVTQVDSVAAAVGRLEKEHFDAVLLDLSLPDAHGREGVIGLKAYRPDLPIIVVSGLADEATALRVVVDGASDFVTKEESSACLLSRAVRYAVSTHRAETRASHLASHDPLTAVGSRAQFEAKLTAMTVDATRDVGAIVWLNLNRFRVVNGRFGTKAGDHVLVTIAKRLLAVVGSEGYVARVSGDEFAILLERAGRSEAAALATRALAAVAEQLFLPGGHPFRVTAAAGVVCRPEDGNTTEALMKAADRAMRTAKTEGYPGFRFRSPTANATASGEAIAPEQLHLSLAQGWFDLVLRPRVDLRTDRMAGATVAPRWLPGRHTAVASGGFLPIEDDGELTAAIGHWTLREACRQGREWHEMGFHATPLVVQLFSDQLLEPDFVSLVARALEESGLAASLLEFDVSQASHYLASASGNAILEQLKRLGVGLSMCAFGGGPSSIDDLRRLVVDHVNLDASLIADLDTNPRAFAVVKAAIGLAQDLGATVGAHGIDTAEQLAWLRGFGCDIGEGDLFGPLLSPLELPSWAAGRSAGVGNGDVA